VDRTSEDRFIFAVVRGDTAVNETKLANALKAKALRPATDEEIRAIGAVPGYASPVGLKDVTVIVDEVIPNSPNLVAGANEEGYHTRNVNYGRDYQAAVVTDITAAQAGDGCPQCGQPLRTVRGVEVGNIFKLGTRYTEALGASYQDKDGQEKPVIMGSYGIGSGRLLACIAEQYHDDHGLMWPITVAPYEVHLTLLIGKSMAEEVQRTAKTLYHDLQQAGIDVLFDDRDESPGVKFNDADLIGLPYRLTVGKKLADGVVELSDRSTRQSSDATLEEAPELVRQKIDSKGLSTR
jgi:prolyl-tRNA synthetase